MMLTGMTNKEHTLEMLLKEQYSEILKRQELYWKDKSRELWITDGDLNTKYFHASSKSRRINNKICSVKDKNEATKVRQDDIERTTIEHFHDVLGNSENRVPSSLPMVDEFIEPLVSMADCKMFLASYSLEEVRCTTFELQPHKAPRLDGMTAELF